MVVHPIRIYFSYGDLLLHNASLRFTLIFNKIHSSNSHLVTVAIVHVNKNFIQNRLHPSSIFVFLRKVYSSSCHNTFTISPSNQHPSMMCSSSFTAPWFSVTSFVLQYSYIHFNMIAKFMYFSTRLGFAP